MLQVTEAYHLRRETFHVAVDFVDRYLSRTSDVAKRQLQLIGVTALFVAAKVEVSATMLAYLTVCDDLTWLIVTAAKCYSSDVFRQVWSIN